MGDYRCAACHSPVTAMRCPYCWSSTIVPYLAKQKEKQELDTRYYIMKPAHRYVLYEGMDRDENP